MRRRVRRTGDFVVSRGSRGKSWEIQLSLWHDAYRRLGAAYVVSIEAPVKQVGGGSPFLAVRAKEGPPDFMGTLDGGRAVVFDAKETLGVRWSFGLLKAHQARDLSANADRGGLSFIALSFSGRGWVVPWEELRGEWWAWKRNGARKASIVEGEMGVSMNQQGCCVTNVKCGVGCGWLGVVNGLG